MFGRLKDWLYDQYRSFGAYGEHWREIEQMQADQELRVYRMEQFFANRTLLNYEFTDGQMERYQERLRKIHARLGAWDGK